MSKRNTIESLNEELIPKGFEVLGPYTSLKEKTKIKCLTCGDIFESDLLHFRKRLICKNCKGVKSTKRTTESIKNEIKEITNGEYEYDHGEFKNVHTKIGIKHLSCGNIFEMSINNFVRNSQRCPNCKNDNRVNCNSKESFEKILKEKTDGEYILISDFINVTRKVTLKHTVCGYKYPVQPNLFIKGNRCPLCSGKLNKSPETYIEEFYKLPDSEDYELLSPYVNNKTKIKIYHKICKQSYDMRPNDFQQGYRCPNCFGNSANKLTTEEVAKRINFLSNGEYDLVGEYKDCRTKISVIHHECGTIYKCKSNEFYNGNRCPECRKSKGEAYICNFLDDNGIKYKHHHKFPDCKYKAVLEFDFYLPTYNTCIEFDGSYHYEIKNYYNDEELNKKELEKQQARDKTKDEYCKKKGLKMIRIPYWDFGNIDTILQEELGLFADDYYLDDIAVE